MMHSFLLIGQSNMAGRGLIEEAHPIDTSRIFTLRNGRWQSMFRPINPDRRGSGVSLGESFAESYVRTYDMDVGLICCADGGTALEQWMPGEALYDNAVHAARLAQRTSTIVGILWHQGESDCAKGQIDTYRARLVQMLTALREDLSLQNVPLVVGGLGDYLVDSPLKAWQLHNAPLITKEIRAAAEELPLTDFVSAEGLGPNPDMLHFSSDALYELGLRYFAAYCPLREKASITFSSAPSDTKRSAIELL